MRKVGPLRCNKDAKNWLRWRHIPISSIEPYAVRVMDERDGAEHQFTYSAIALDVDPIRLDSLRAAWVARAEAGLEAERDVRHWEASTDAAIRHITDYGGHLLWGAREAYTEESGRIRTRGATVVQMPGALRPACSAPHGRVLLDVDVTSCHQVVAGVLAGDLDYARSAGSGQLRDAALRLLPTVEPWRVKMALLALLNQTKTGEHHTVSEILGDASLGGQLVVWWRYGVGKAIAAFKDDVEAFVRQELRRTGGRVEVPGAAGRTLAITADLADYPSALALALRPRGDASVVLEVERKAARAALYHTWCTRESWATNGVIRDLTAAGIPVAVPAYDGLVAVPRVGQVTEAEELIAASYARHFSEVGIDPSLVSLKRKVSQTWS